jgi:hypothetical protein
MMRAAWQSASDEPTDVPPNFMTSVFGMFRVGMRLSSEK